MSDIHPVVALLAKRMKSHPEEFGPEGSGRWDDWMSDILERATEAERLILRKPAMDNLHEAVMDELLNGEERRNREYEAQIERSRSQSLGASLRNALSPALQQMQSQHELDTLRYQQAITTINASEAYNSTLNIGGETLDAGLIRKVKKALGV